MKYKLGLVLFKKETGEWSDIKKRCAEQKII